MSEEKKSKKEIEHEQLKEIRKKDDEILKSALSIKDTDVNSEIYFEMDSYVDMAIDGISTGTIIEGVGGVGKTFRILNKVSNSNIDYAYLDSFTTPQGMYVWVHKNKDRDLLILDDVVGLSNDKALSFLKAMLWSVKGRKRIVTYNSSKPIKDEDGIIVPNVTELNARVIIITNQLNQTNPHVRAVVSRVNYCKIDIPREEVLRIMEQVAKKEYDGLTEKERLDVFKFLKDNTTESCENLNLRTLIKSFQYMIFAKNKKEPELWKKLILKSLKQDTDVLIVQKIIEDESFKDEDERIKEFENITGKSRATYFRIKKKL